MNTIPFSLGVGCTSLPTVTIYTFILNQKEVAILVPYRNEPVTNIKMVVLNRTTRPRTLQRLITALNVDECLLSLQFYSAD